MLRLRPCKPADVDILLSWWEGKDRDIFLKWSAGKFSYPLTREQLEDYYETWVQKENNGWIMTALDEEGRMAGQLLMRLADYKTETIRFGFIVVDPKVRGQGYGHQMITLALKYAGEILGMKTVTLGVFENNLQARNCYESAGFRLTGAVSDRLKDGDRTLSVYEMEAFLDGE